MDFLEETKKFFDNGGFLGYLNGFDSEKEGRVYNFEDLKKDVGSAVENIKDVGKTLLDAFGMEAAV